jgi:transcription antitermination factor NusG
MSETLPEWAELKPGCRVRVISGPFAGVEGVVETKRCKGRSEVTLDLLQSGVSLEIDECRLQAIQFEAKSPAPPSEFLRNIRL